MDAEHSNITLRERIEALPEDTVLFRSDFPEYHSEFVGGTLAELTQEGVLVKLAQGIYAKPRRSRFGFVLPSVDKIAQAIAACRSPPFRDDSVERIGTIKPSPNEVFISDDRERKDN